MLRPNDASHRPLLLRNKFILLKLDCKGCVTPSSGPADLAIRLEQRNVSFLMQGAQYPWVTRNDRQGLFSRQGINDVDVSRAFIAGQTRFTVRSNIFDR